MIPATISMSQIKAYGRDGAVMIPGLVTPREATLLKRGIKRNLLQPGPYFKDFGSGNDASGVCVEDRCSWPNIPEYQEFVRSSAVAATAGALLGSAEIRLLEDQYLLKKAGSSTSTPWHQDQPAFDISGSWVSFWIALSHIAHGDGLEVVARSHKLRQLYPSRAFTGQIAQPRAPDQLPDRGAEPADWVILSWAMTPGDAIAFDPYAIHGSGGCHGVSHALRFVVRLVAEDAVYLPATLPRKQLNPGYGLDTGEPLRGPFFPLLWQCDPNSREVSADTREHQS